jgi:predicted nucleotidyltransferase
MDESQISVFLSRVTHWAEGHSDILAVILVGSQARGDAKLVSDIDLVIICSDPNHYLKDADWVHEFGIPVRKKIEDWGKVTSLRIGYEDLLEVEFGITNEEWAKEPLDAGTKRVIDGGYRILIDKTGSLSGVLAQPAS